jgi:hypothetical protein
MEKLQGTSRIAAGEAARVGQANPTEVPGQIPQGPTAAAGGPSIRQVGQPRTSQDVGAPFAARQRPPQQISTLDISAASRTDASARASAASVATESAQAASSLAAFPATARAMEAGIQAAKGRPVSVEEAAALVNELRRFGPRAHQSPELQAAQSNRDLMGSITEAQVMRWYAAQGLNEQDVAALRRGALTSGLPNPTGTFLMNAMQFIVAPSIAAATGNAWLGAGLGTAIAFASPLANAFQQSGVVTLCEHIRERQGPSVAAQKSSINDKQWLPAIAADVSKRAEVLVEKGEKFEATLGALLREHPDIGGTRDEQLVALLPRLADGQKDTLRQHSEELHDAEQSLHALQKELLMTQGAHKRQFVGNTNQIVPRALRGSAAALVGLASGAPAGAAVAAQVAGRVAQLTPLQAAGVQAAASLFLSASQHIAAGYDERNKQEYNNKLNMMYADIFTDAGKQNWADGKELVGADISAQKLRSFVSSPAQVLAKRLATNISARAASVEAEIASIHAQASERSAASGAGSSAGSQHAPHLDEGERLVVDMLGELATRMRSDEAHLRAGTVTQLQPDGVAAGLLAGSLDRFTSSFLKEDLIAKYKKPGELAAQTAQRIGQTFHMVFAGSGAAALIAKLGTAAKGGASKTPTPVILGLAATSLTLGTIGAVSQSTAINIKNVRRESEGDSGIMTQIRRGVLAAPIEIRAQHAANGANHDAGQAMERIQENSELAKVVRQQLQPVAETA